MAPANGSRLFLVTVPGSTEAARHYKSVLDEVEAERGGRAAMSVTQPEVARAYARRGALWDLYRENFGPEGNSGVLVIRAPTQAMRRARRCSPRTRSLSGRYTGGRL